MLNILKFTDTIKPKIAILVKTKAFKEKEIFSYYIKPLVDSGIPKEEIIALNLEYNNIDKASVSFIKEHLQKIEKVVQHYKLSHLLCTDAGYFKVLAKVKTSERSYGYSLQSIYPGVQVSLSCNYQSLYFNPSLQDKLSLGIVALSRDYFQNIGIFDQSPITHPRYPNTLQEVEDELNFLLAQEILACDIETAGLHLKQGKPITIAFAENQKSGCSFDLNSYLFQKKVDNLILQFFKEYKNKLVFHNATFDIGRLVRYYFMDHPRDTQGMLFGLDRLCSNFDDTKLMAYIQVNTASGNSLSLKDLAFEYIGNYALEGIKDISNIDQNKLLEYNLTDACATQYLFYKFRDSLDYPIYKDLYKPALRTITQKELCGMPINKEKVAVAKEQLTEISNKHIEAIKSSKIVQELEMRLKLDAAISANSKLKKLRKTSEDFGDLEFNPRSNKQTRILLYELLQLPILRFTDTNLPSTDSTALRGLINHLKSQ